MKFTFLILCALIGTQAHARPVSMSRDYSQIQKYLADLQSRYPQNSELMKIGENEAGISIMGLKIGSGPVHNLVVGTHHGNEYGSTEVALQTAADFAANPIEGQTVFVIPVLNISGFNLNRRNEDLRGGGTADPNRNYPGPCATEGPLTLASTRALADFIDRENIVVSATLHTSGSYVLYPWGLSTHDLMTPYNDLYIQLAQAGAFYSDYTVGNSTAELYPADGAYEDYAYWQHGVWSLLFEIGHTHSPDETELARIGRENVPGIRKFLMEAPKVRAVDHAFHGRCDVALRFLDIRME